MRFEMEREAARLVGDAFGHGPQVVLLHAGRERRRVWDRVVEILAGHGYGCVTLDMRGHGESHGPHALLDVLIEDAAALAARLSGSAVWVGASLGGLVSLGLAGSTDASRRERIAALVLVDVFPDPDPERVRAGLTATIGRHVAESPRVRDILSRPDEMRAMAARGAQPTLAVRAEKSFASGPEDVVRLRGLIPHLADVVIPECGHLVAKERPDALARALVEFLARTGVSARHAVPNAASTGARADALLRKLGAGEIPHLAGKLLDHLRRTAHWLERWEAPEHVRLAGLCHAAYGTEGFDRPLLEDRATLREVIGPRAEELVYRYCACAREHCFSQLGAEAIRLRDRFTGAESQLSREEVGELALLTIANELDVVRHSAPEPELRNEIVDLIERLRGHRRREADAALRAIERGA